MPQYTKIIYIVYHKIANQSNTITNHVNGKKKKKSHAQTIHNQKVAANTLTNGDPSTSLIYQDQHSSRKNTTIRKSAPPKSHSK